MPAYARGVRTRAHRRLRSSQQMRQTTKETVLWGALYGKELGKAGRERERGKERGSANFIPILIFAQSFRGAERCAKLDEHRGHRGLRTRKAVSDVRGGLPRRC